MICCGLMRKKIEVNFYCSEYKIYLESLLSNEAK